ncbi:MAG: tRNA epoxyqueuosine(34) reductase QueG [Hyphomicrobiales bacterium]
MTSLADRLRQRAAQEGFSLVRIAPAAEFAGAGARLREFVALGRHGDMDWIEATLERRGDPRRMWAEARSAVMLAASYTPKIDPMARLKKRGTGVISVYAMGRDYHDVVKGMLKRLGRWFADESGAGIKVFIDTAPLMEKPLAQAAGLGWQGKHTNLLSRELGSWFFIGAILTAAELPFDRPETDHCGACRACLDICPTHAFPAPYQLDARRCISYLTIEHEGHIAREFREAIGNRIYGCDDCLAVCPWNKFAKAAADARLEARDDLVAPALAELVELDDRAFRAKFAGTAIKRTGRDRFVRNVLIALGNSDDAELASVAERRLGDASPLVRAMAVWALSRLAPPGRFSALRQQHLAGETDPGVRSEWLPA